MKRSVWLLTTTVSLLEHPFCVVGKNMYVKVPRKSTEEVSNLYLLYEAGIAYGKHYSPARSYLQGTEKCAFQGNLMS